MDFGHYLTPTRKGRGSEENKVLDCWEMESVEGLAVNYEALEAESNSFVNALGIILLLLLQ